VQWLSKRLDKPLKVPDLTAHGFDLVGGRLLPGDAGARAQFMFQNASGQRVTLYLGAVDKAAAGITSQETGFQFEPQAGIPSFYWVDQGFGYALAGQLPRASLMQLAQEIYRQL
jgi:anti-sigma factor RsiW